MSVVGAVDFIRSGQYHRSPSSALHLTYWIRRTMYWVKGKEGHFSHNFGITAHQRPKFSEYLS